ncbi:hypothetical protein [Citrobacter farmeri]
MANGQIVQGSRTVLIGSQGGIACSVCPGSVSWRYDAGGRIAEEVQTTYNADGETIWQHKARHHYDALGNEHQTQYGALPQTGWQRYGSGPAGRKSDRQRVAGLPVRHPGTAYRRWFGTPVWL